MTNWSCSNCNFETSGTRVSFPLVCPRCKTIYAKENVVFDLLKKNNDRENKLARALLLQQKLDGKMGRLSSDPKTVGRQAWRNLHSYFGCDPQFLPEWEKNIPSSCSCAESYSGYKRLFPPDFSSPLAFFNWGMVVHNLVNAKLKKPVISLDRARMLWRHERPQTDRTRAIVTVANGTKFVETLKLTRPYMQAYADRCDADLIDLDNDTEDWGRMEKFRVWHFARQYDEVLFVDADCVIRESCPNIFESHSEDIAAHDDWSRLYKTDWLERERQAVATKTGLDIKSTSQCLNSGVILSRKSACDIWQRPAIDIGTTHCAEQIWLEHRIDDAVSSGATLGKLDARFNWQWWFGTHDEGAFEAGLDDAWIVHFANAHDRIETIRDYIATL